MGEFHAPHARYKAPYPEVRWGIVPSNSLSSRVLNPKGAHPGQWLYRDMKINVHRYNVYRPYYDEFEQDIIKNGFRNPVLCWSRDGHTSVLYGTTRMALAQKNDLPIPAFIVDWDKAWAHLELVTSREQALTKFKDPPTELILEPDFFNYYNEPNEYDPVCQKLKQSVLTTASSTEPSTSVLLRGVRLLPAIPPSSKVLEDT